MNVRRLLTGMLGLAVLLNTLPAMAQSNAMLSATKPKVFIVPIREGVESPLVYVVRRGVKEAMEANADAIIFDMDTYGGAVITTQEIIEIISKFKGTTITYVNTKAFSAGAFISVATRKIYMAPQSVIGAAAIVMQSPGGTGIEELPDTVEAKMTSGFSAIIRAQAEKNGHNVDVVQAMIDKTKELIIDGELLNKEGNILTLTDVQAAKEYGTPAKPLLSSGTVESVDALLKLLGYADATRVDIKPSGAEKLGTWINKISPILLAIGIIGLYIEFKTPGFGIPGIVGIVAFAIYFLGGYVAGLSAPGWIVLFILGIVLVLVELLLVPGTFIAGISGVMLMLVALIMGMVDVYPGAPTVPALPDLKAPLRDLSLAVLIALGAVLILARYLPETSIYHKLVSQSASGVQSVAAVETRNVSRLGKTGLTVTNLSPGGKARFDEDLLDVMTRGERIEKGRRVRIIGHSGMDAVVEEIT
jgi:membrane-bound serine protease (ClpP class)